MCAPRSLSIYCVQLLVCSSLIEKVLQNANHQRGKASYQGDFLMNQRVIFVST